jgi:hypothetical protein
MAHPHQTLKEIGIQIPPSVKIHVRNEEPGTWELVLRKIREPSISDADLEKASGGNCNWSQGDSHCF